ncbi:YdcH family protein [Sulfitobacter sp.]|uniref:YdcH family protein n=1 Tax=Sulfitobacter sp. TaxID=1903071 RepID=UPI003EF1E3E9
MSNTPHELSEEFPQNVEQMATLRQADTHFAKLSDSYHTVNRAIHRAETDVEPTSDDHMQEMRRERIALKDQIAAYLREKA